MRKGGQVVGTAALEDGSVTTAKLANGAVTSVKVAAGTRDYLNHGRNIAQTVTVGTPVYVKPSGASAAAEFVTTENECQQRVPVAVTLKEFTVRNWQTPPAGSTVTLTLRKNGVATALTVSFTNADAAPTVKTATADVSFAVGDLLSIEISAAGANGVAGHNWTIRGEI